MTEESTKPPKVFISYAWEDDVKPWVRAFAKRLRKDGVETVLDLWETDYGDQLPEFMEKAVRESDFVILICTPKYKKKSDDRQGGVGYEGHIITAEIFEKNNHRKFIPVLRKGGWRVSSPSWAAGKLYIDLSGNPYAEDNYRDLLRTLHGKKPTPPPVGKPPEFPDEDDEHPKKPKPRVPRKPLLSKDDVDKFVASLRNFVRKITPLLRVAGVLIVVGALFWTGSWAVPKLVTLIPTQKATVLQQAITQITSTNSSIVPSITTMPISALTIMWSPTPAKNPTSTMTPTLTMIPSSTVTPTRTIIPTLLPTKTKTLQALSATKTPTLKSRIPLIVYGETTEGEYITAAGCCDVRAYGFYGMANDNISIFMTGGNGSSAMIHLQDQNGKVITQSRGYEKASIENFSLPYTGVFYILEINAGEDGAVYTIKLIKN